MVTINPSCEPPGGLCAPNGTSRENFSALEAGQSAPHDGLIITGSFNGILDRLAKIDYFEVWHEWAKAKKVARKQKREPTIRMAEVQEMTGLTREDLKLLTTAIPLIEIVEAGADPLLSFSEVYCVVKIFSKMVGDGVIT